jgi:hypothetical protein
MKSNGGKKKKKTLKHITSGVQKNEDIQKLVLPTSRRLRMEKTSKRIRSLRIQSVIRQP